ncbi:hypothetical protein C0Q71_06985 [Klebsiella pneumoniae]|nr:hypothetical protein [Klebsiella pneumoniae]
MRDKRQVRTIHAFGNHKTHDPCNFLFLSEQQVRLNAGYFSANARQGTLLWCDFCKQELILVNEKIVLIYG